MRRFFLLSLSLLFLLLVLAPAGFVQDAVRSVRPFSPRELLASTRFDPNQSAGLFVGIRRFTHDVAEVRYAADDAVDLAYAFAMSAGERLVLPSRVVIALSGQPSKKESKERLKALKAAGAEVVEDVDQNELLELLHKQVAVAGRDGMMIVSFATHGFNTNGVPYLLAASSSFSRDTTLSAAKVAEIVSDSAARRSLLFFDACRERVSADTRGIVARPAAPLVDKMARVEGQVIFYAAAPGGYAHDDPSRGNGVFTAAVIDALRCEAGTPAMITVDKLASRVENQVLAFLRKRDPMIRKATQISMEGLTRFMPLAQCRVTGLGSPTQVSTVNVRGSTLEVFDLTGRPLWHRELDGAIRQTFVEQLFREDTRQVVVLSDDGSASVISIYDNAGNLLAAYRHDGPLRFLQIAKPTWRHNPRIVAAGMRRDAAAKLDVFGFVPTVCLIEPKNTGGAEEKWYGAILDARETITDLEIDGDNRQRQIVLSTSAGSTIRLDFEGSVIGIDRGKHATTNFSLIAP
ncbi:MAG: caspase domain-containing protein [Thermoanaerobaculia bacterium]